MSGPLESPVEAGSLFADVPRRLASERFDTLLAAPGWRLERIVSTGQATPPGQWYDQDTHEWVVLLRGSAELRLEGEAAPRRLRPGDHVLIAAHVRHRVERTDPAEPTVWLALHYRAPGAGGPTAAG